MSHDDARYYSRIGGMECSDVPDGYVIYDDPRGQVHYLNLTAAAVWELCDGQSNAQTIAEILQDAFGLPAAPRQDVDECLKLLRSQNLIESHDQRTGITLNAI